jgi:membrane-bound lytic murein transglycosylase B
MDRRDLLLLVLAGCADTSTRIVPPATPAPAPQSSAPRAPEPVQTPEAAAHQHMRAWLADFRPRALAAGVSPQVFDREMAGITSNPRILALDGRQPEFSKPIGDYVRGAINAERIAGGQRRRDGAYFAEIEQRYGVPREVLIAIWGMESAFGAVQGDFDVLRSMATLAAEGRRRAFAEGEVIAALKMIQTGERSRDGMRGSWAGAMGQTQFIPSSFLSMAVDGDGDGRRDLWASSADALASAANLLVKGGWVRGQSWAREVTVPADFDYSLVEGPRETPDWWAQRGVVRADGQPWSDLDRNAPAGLIAPSGANGPIFLAFPNHFAIRKYNNSTAYALGVGLLADAIAGGGQLVRAWPAETPLALDDRLAAQRALAKLGFDPGQPDGVIGVNTRTALRAWQKARGLTADGYLSLDMVSRLRSEAQV